MPYVTDTHPLLWHMTGDQRLSSAAKDIFDKEDIYIPCIVFFEMLYLIEKKKIPVNFATLVTMVSSSQNYRVEPICLPIIERARVISKETLPDPWDRLIAATSIHLKLPLISRDKSLGKIGLQVIW